MLAACTRVVSGNKTMNSSPPYRPNISTSLNSYKHILLSHIKPGRLPVTVAVINVFEVVNIQHDIVRDVESVSHV